MASPSTAATTVARFVAKLDRAAIRDHDAVEATLGVRLEPAGDNPSFLMWKADQTLVDGLRLTDVRYREPKPDGPATAGAILILGVSEESCVPQADIRAAFPALKLTGAPGGARDEQAMFGQRIGGATLSFGFPGHGRDCLATIVYALDRP